MEFAGLNDVLTVDGLPVVRHGDHGKAHALPLFSELRALGGVAVVALAVVGDQLERRAAIPVVVEGVVVHGHVAARVAEGQHRLLADVLGDLQHLVGLEVLDQKHIRAHQRVVRAEDVVQAVFVALIRGLQLDVHADDVLIGDIQHALNVGAADEAVAARADVALEAVVLEVLHDLDHRQVEGLGIGHARKAVRLAHDLAGDEIGKLLKRHARVGLRRVGGVQHVHALRVGAVQRVVAQHPAEFQHLLIRRVGGVSQYAPRQQIVFQVGRVQLRAERAVHVEGGDAVRLRDEVLRIRVGHRLHIVDQRVQRRGVRVPLGKRRFNVALRQRREAAQQHRNDQYN